jgi:hypothetical protein
MVCCASACCLVTLGHLTGFVDGQTICQVSDELVDGQTIGHHVSFSFSMISRSQCCAIISNSNTLIPITRVVHSKQTTKVLLSRINNITLLCTRDAHTADISGLGQ